MADTAKPALLYLHPALTVIAYKIKEKNRVLIRGGADNVTFEDTDGQFAQWLGSLDHGSRTKPDALEEGIAALEERGVLVSQAPIQRDWLIDLFDFTYRNLYSYKLPYEITKVQEIREMKTKTVMLLHQDSVSAAAAPMLEGMGYHVRLEWDSKDSVKEVPTLYLMTAERHDSAILNAANKRAMDSRTPILFAVVDEYRVRIGPMVFPGNSGCFHCYEQRTLAAVEFTEILETTRDVKALVSARNGSAVLCNLAASLAAVELSKHLEGLPHLLDLGRVVEFDAVSGTQEAGIVLRSPRCDICGEHLPAQTPRAVSWTM